METSYEKIVKIIAEILEVDTALIDEETAIGDLTEWDSLHHIKIISAIENQFGFRFAPDDMMDMEDVSDIVNATEVRAGK